MKPHIIVPNSRWPHTAEVVDKVANVLCSVADRLVNATATETGTEQEFPEESIACLSVTLDKACARLNKMLDDDMAWAHDGVAIAEVKRLISEQAELAKQQRTTAEMSRLPSRILGCSVRRVAGGWAAVNGQIVGRGASPMEAIRDFDRAAEAFVPPEQAEAERNEAAREAEEQSERQAAAAAQRPRRKKK